MASLSIFEKVLNIKWVPMSTFYEVYKLLQLNNNLDLLDIVGLP